MCHSQKISSFWTRLTNQLLFITGEHNSLFLLPHRRARTEPCAHGVGRRHVPAASELIDRTQGIDTPLQPQPDTVSAFRDSSEQRRVARFHCVAQCLDSPAFSGESLGDASVERPESLRFLREPPPLTVVLINGCSRIVKPLPPALNTSAANASIDAIRRPAFLSPVTSPIRPGSGRSESAISSTKS